MSPEAMALIHEDRIKAHRRLFTERRNKFWRRAWPVVAIAAAWLAWRFA